jgi:cyclopropane-fatty-acyl-phospholipid synthase
LEINSNMKLDTANPPASASSSPVVSADDAAPQKSVSTKIEPPDGHPTAPRRSFAVERWLLRRVLAACGDPAVRFVLWDGEAITTSPEMPVGNVIVHNPATLRRLIVDPRLAFGDAYSEGAIDVQTSLVDVLSDISRAISRAVGGGLLGRLAHRRRRSRAHTLDASRESVHHHYDLGNDFYRIWLDEGMQYTCAYYSEPGCTLEEAQLAKLEHVCRKLQLRSGDRVLEAGCGWGGLALHMAERYGATVRAFTLSHEQAAFARARAGRGPCRPG